MTHNGKPLLLVDDNNILSIINEGEFKCFNLTFEEVKAMLDTYPEDAVAKWEVDRKFVFNYKSGDCPEVIVRKITIGR